MAERMSFEQFVARQQNTGTALNKEAEQRDWQLAIESFYEKVKSYLGKHLDSGEIKKDFDTVWISEELFGRYEAKRLVLLIGNSQVVFEPVGRFILGARGRIDLIGPYGAVPFLYVDKRVLRTSDLINVSVTMPGEAPLPPVKDSTASEFEWKYLPPSSVGPRLFHDLSAEILQRSIMDVLNVK